MLRPTADTTPANTTPNRRAHPLRRAILPVAGAALLALTGCVAYDPYAAGGYYAAAAPAEYPQPVYPAPVYPAPAYGYVAPTIAGSVVIGTGWGHGWGGGWGRGWGHRGWR